MDNVTVTFEPEGSKVKASVGSTVLNVAKEAGISIRSECGGKGLCGKCRIIIMDKDAVSGLTEAEKKHLSQLDIDRGYRLACQTKIFKNVVVTVPMESRLGILKVNIMGKERNVNVNPFIKKLHVVVPKPTPSDTKPDFERLVEILRRRFKDLSDIHIDYEVLKKMPDVLRNAHWDVTLVIWNTYKIIEIELGDTSGEVFGLAVDIGTSKIVGHLVDLTSGKTVAMGWIENPQIAYGEDIITRITYASTSDANLETLQKLTVDGLNKVLHEVCEKAGVDPNKIYEILVVGNTAIHHLFFGIQPKYVALSPYVPAVKGTLSLAARDLNVRANPHGVVTALPIVAGFVGADAIADVLATGIYESEENSLLIDIGTNTEIFVGNKDDLICCSCASGPAFEGAHIRYGMKAVTGAIERIRIKPDLKVEYETIGNVKPRGLCGSAVIDAIAEMFKHGIINNRGRFNPNIETPRLRRGYDGWEFVIAWRDETMTGREITVTQKDITEIQLAKAAIYSGCSILMKRRKFREEDIDVLFIAGAFGNYVNPENAKIIGLIPDIPTEKIRFVGNTAIAGAKMALISKEVRDVAEYLARVIRYHELAADADFNSEFLNALLIPNRIIERFPSVKKYLQNNA